MPVPPTGFRRLTPGLLKIDRVAEAFAGLPEGVTALGQLLAALKAAAPRLGLSPRLVHAIDWLFRFTQLQDWQPGGRPIVWPSASLQQEALGLSPTRAKAINRALIEAGLITMKDSPNGKRYGRRDAKGRIIEGYGFDLSPLAARYGEFLRLAAEAKVEREELRRLRRRATIARNGVAQILETAAEYGFVGEEWERLARETRDITQALKRVELPDEMALGVDNLERRQRLARERLENLLAKVVAPVQEAVNPTPMGAENGPHQYSYKPSLDPEQDTVVANNACSPTGGKVDAEQSAPVIPQSGKQGRVLKLRPDELVHLAPRLKPYLPRSNPTWPELVDAADGLRADLDVSRPLWGEACVTMGREQAAIAIAIVSTKDPGHFRTTAGGYFRGMVEKAKSGQLNLDRTLWGLRQARDTRAPMGPKRATGLGDRPRPAASLKPG